MASTRDTTSFNADHTSLSISLSDEAAVASLAQSLSAFAQRASTFLGLANLAANDNLAFGNLSAAAAQPDIVLARSDKSPGSRESELPVKESLVLSGQSRRIVEREGGVSAANPERVAAAKAMKIGLDIDETYLQEIKADMASPIGGTRVRPLHLNAWLSVPDVILLVNPGNLDWSLTNSVQDTRTRGGFMQEFWASELDTLTASGTSAVAYVASFSRPDFRAGIARGAAVGASLGSAIPGLGGVLGAIAGGIVGGITAPDKRQGGGLTIRDLRSDSAGYRNLRRLVDVYRSNGIIYGMRAMGNYAVGNGPEKPAFRKALLYGGFVTILYDGITYRGFFENFEIREAGEMPFWLEWNFTFKVESHTGKDLKMYDSGKFLGKSQSAQAAEFSSLSTNATGQRNT